MDKMTGTRKPFAFVGFDSEQAVEQLCAVSKHTVGSKMVRLELLCESRNVWSLHAELNVPYSVNYCQCCWV